MISPKNYFPIIKTKDAELRGMCSLAQETKNDIVPLFELTRSRITPKLPDGPVAKRLAKIATDYGTTPLSLDLTSFTDLQNSEIRGYYDAKDGFQKWTQFIYEQTDTFPDIYPVLLISDEGISSEDEYCQRHRPEVASLLDSCGKLIYRISGDYEALQFDLENLFDSSNQPIVVLDMEYIPREKGEVYAQKACQSLEIIDQHGVQHVILTGSSFPKDPTENGDQGYGENKLEEVLMYNHCKRQFSELIYGDYASIYPLPNERAGGRGWVPRIDFPSVSEDLIVYYRDKKKTNEGSYKNAYIRVAQKVVRDRRFLDLKTCIGQQNWGIQQILLAAEGYPPGLNPSFWISVRINLHVTLRQLKLRES